MVNAFLLFVVMLLELATALAVGELEDFGKVGRRVNAGYSPYGGASENRV